MKHEIYKKSSFILRWTAFFLLFLFGGSAAYAGGAFMTLENGTPVLWENNKVTYRLETGGLRGTDAGEEDKPGSSGDQKSTGGGCALNKEIASKALEINSTEFGDMVRAGFKAWSDAAGGDLVIEEGPSLGVNVNFANAQDFIAGSFPATGDVSTVDVNKCYSTGECINAIVADPNGLITEAIVGQCSRFGTFGVTTILPKTGSDGSVTDPKLKSAQMIINGTCLEPAEKGSDSFDCPKSECPKEFSKADIQSVITHEAGHFIALDHSFVVKANDSKCQKDPPESGCDQEAEPTMIGLFRKDANLHTLHFDDIATVKRYYSNAAKAASGGNCTIKGTVYKSSARTTPPGKVPAQEWRCAEVVAKKDGADLTAAGFISGSEASRTKSDGTQDDCSTGTAGCGAFEIRGLPAGTYTMGVHDFSSDDRPEFGGEDWTGFNIEPCHGPLSSNAFNDNDPAIEGAVTQTVVCPAGGGVQPIDLFTN